MSGFVSRVARHLRRDPLGWFLKTIWIVVRTLVVGFAAFGPGYPPPPPPPPPPIEDRTENGQHAKKR